jgi:UDP-glucose 4-epimerase
MRKNILVTGGAGFVGSHLCEALVAQGHSVTSIDNYFTGSAKNHVPGVTYVKGTTDSMRLEELPRFDIVYHLGEYSRVEQSFDDINLVHRYNINGTFRLLQAARNWGSKIIYAGSSTKFADDDKDYMISPYAFFKKQNTELVKQFCEWYHLDFAITYFYNVYGPREIREGKYATLIAKYMDRYEKGLPLQVVAPGTQKRNFTHIADIVQALILIGINGHGDEYGIGHPESFTIQEVAEMFQAPVEMLPPRKGNRMSAPVLTSKTRALGWEPEHNLREYVSDFLFAKGQDEKLYK